MLDIRQRAILIKTLFSSEDGKQLLKDLNETFCSGRLYHPDPEVRMKNIVGHDLIQDFNYYLNLSDAELNEIVKQSNQDSFFEE